MERKVASRLGSGVTDADELKRSAYFRSLDFDSLLNLGYEPEFKPPASRSEADVSNFDPEFTREQAADSVVVSHMSATLQEKTAFEGFTYEPNQDIK